MSFLIPMHGWVLGPVFDRLLSIPSSCSSNGRFGKVDGVQLRLCLLKFERHNTSLQLMHLNDQVLRQ